ncbi:NAD(P)-dependent alcohol dehydrogenase [Cellulomonas sp. WB94]|uniref:NAD(P)-dependent alcohol dehydrogenase n=1 Tax=Cellulomonas sp. WB94 TaxID=2173174 RepID=UPI000D56E2BE|nr:NAD(P)-dependent alcohol dehydrogenase [Cellulomonas sp. WB94]PVU82216.1 NAD(P)-dependent alcohol dehydrogenase [Cellulomonas sp. WB94]
MKAIVQDTYGSADVLRLDDVDPPSVGPDDVLIRVRAAGVDAGVWHLMAGRPFLMRAMGFGLRAPRARTRGLEVAGVVEAVGAQVTELHPGDRVFGTCNGSFAQYATARPGSLALLPPTVSFEQAAVVPVSGVTALQALRDAGKVQAGQRVLVIGAGGGVGSFAVQLATAFGAEVTGVCSTAKVDLVRSLGADDVIDYTSEEITATGRRYDLVLDTAGNRPLSLLRQVLAPHGTLVVVGGENGGRWLGGIQRSLGAVLLSPFVRHTLRGLFSTVRPDDLSLLAGLIASGQVTPVVGATYPLDRAADAVRHQHEGHAVGKVVLTVPDDAAVTAGGA